MQTAYANTVYSRNVGEAVPNLEVNLVATTEAGLITEEKSTHQRLATTNWNNGGGVLRASRKLNFNV